RRLAARARVAALAVLHHFGSALQHADLADARDRLRTRAELHTELEVLVGIEALRVYDELSHGSLSPQASIWPAICCSLITTNSAGLSGAKPTWMFTMPRLMSFCVVVDASQFTKYASRGDAP